MKISENINLASAWRHSLVHLNDDKENEEKRNEETVTIPFKKLFNSRPK